MSRSRLVVSLSAAVVAVGAMAATGLLFLDPARAAVGPLPGEGLSLPADARFVAGLDVKRLIASPFYKKYAPQGSRPEPFAELEVLMPARDYRNRHASILLAWDATLAAFDEASAAA